MIKYGVFSGSNPGKYRPEKTPCLDTFHAVSVMRSSNVNEVIRAVLKFLLFFFYEKISHTRNVRCDDCKQSPHILRFVSMCVLTIRECEDSRFEYSQLGSCKYRCAYMNLVVGSSVFSTFTL